MKTPRLETRLCFAPDSLSGPDILTLVEKGLLGFEPRFIRGRDVSTDQREISISHLRKIGRLKTPESLYLSTQRGFDRESSFSTTLYPAKDVLTLAWTLPARVLPPGECLASLCARSGFNAGLSFDADDAFWQSLSDADTFRALGGRSESMRFARDPDFMGRRIIDTRQNPGRLELFPGFWMGAAWRIYFGALAIALLGRDRILSFPGTFSKLNGDADLLVLTLFEDPHRVASRDERKQQRRLRQWLGLDDFAAVSSEHGDDEGGLMIEEGRFPHGGIRRITARYDAKGRLARRKLAVRENVFELDAQGAITWRGKERRLR